MLSVALLSLAISTMSSSGFGGPRLLGVSRRDNDAELRMRPAERLAEPAPLAEHRTAPDVGRAPMTAVDSVGVPSPGTDGLVLARPQAVAPGADGKSVLTAGADRNYTAAAASGVLPVGVVATTDGWYRRVQRVANRGGSDDHVGSWSPRNGGGGAGVTPKSTAVASAGEDTPATLTATATSPGTGNAGEPTETATQADPTDTATPPTETPIPSSTPTPTAVPPTPTDTPDAAAAARATATAQALLPDNETVVPNTPTPTNTATRTPTPTPTRTPTPRPTRTPTPVAPTATRTPTPGAATPTPSSGSQAISLSQVIAWRGDHNPPHEVVLADPMGCCYSWGQTSTEDTPAISGSHTVNAWIVAFRSADQQNTTPDVRINIRRLYAYVHTGGVWKKIYDGNLSGQWLASSNGDTSGDYQNITPTIEPDGTYSFVIPPNRALHMGSNAPGLLFNGSDAVVSIVEARLVGPGTATFGIAAGADFRDSSGNGSSIEQSCWGHLGLLTKEWRSLSCLSSSLSDAQILQDPPPIN